MVKTIIVSIEDDRELRVDGNTLIGIEAGESVFEYNLEPEDARTLIKLLEPIVGIN